MLDSAPCPQVKKHYFHVFKFYSELNISELIILVAPIIRILHALGQYGYLCTIFCCFTNTFRLMETTSTLCVCQMARVRFSSIFRRKFTWGKPRSPTVAVTSHCTCGPPGQSLAGEGRHTTRCSCVDSCAFGRFKNP